MNAGLQGPPGTTACPPEWLTLREPADAEARATALAAAAAAAVARASARGTAPGPAGRVLVHDLGCGTGSMARWLAPQLPAPQHWVLHDRDPDLLDHARAGLPTGVTGEARHGDLTRLTPAALAGTSLVTASALLDLLTADEVDRLAATCVRTGCPALLTLSVTGRVRLDPADPLDQPLAAAFDAHQRRRDGGRRLLGPDAVDVATAAFARHGAAVRVADSPWRLGPDRADLLREWLDGWVDAACAMRPELRGPAATYRERRLGELERRRLSVTVGHADLLALPDAAGRPS